MGVVTFETFIKGREEVILRQTDEITEISTPVIRVWDGILSINYSVAFRLGIFFTSIFNNPKAYFKALAKVAFVTILDKSIPR